MNYFTGTDGTPSLKLRTHFPHQRQRQGTSPARAVMWDIGLVLEGDGAWIVLAENFVSLHGDQRPASGWLLPWLV